MLIKLFFISIKGGLDKNGRCIITIPSNRDQKTAAAEASSGVKYEELSVTLQYLNRIPRFAHLHILSINTRILRKSMLTINVADAGIFSFSSPLIQIFEKAVLI